MNSLMTVSALQQKCIELAQKIGGKAEVSVSFGSRERPGYVSAHRDGIGKPDYKYADATRGWVVAFAEIEEWIAQTSVPTAWFADPALAPADAVAGE